MLALEFVVILGVVILACTLLARRVRIAPPVVLIIGGVAVGFIPALRGVELPSEIVLLLFLPALLYWESLTTSLREIRANLRGIVLMSTGLVVATAAAVAVVAHLLGLAWGPAWVLGAALAPTDATAVAALTRGLPRRNLTVLRAESLINDGTALVLYGIAVAVTVGEAQVDAFYISWNLVLSYGGGILAGGIIAWIAILVRRRVNDPVMDNVAILLIPFSAFLVAEAIGASGVLAVVVAGLAMSQAGPRVGHAQSRQLTQPFWSFSTYILNAALFVLVGIEVQKAVRGLSSVDLRNGLIAVAGFSVILVVVRFVFLFASTYAIRVLDRRPSQRERRMPHRARVISGLAGFRGAVSLAAALAVPATLSSGASFPGRDFIIFVTAGVIVVTIVVQGLVLPVVVRWAALPADEDQDSELKLAERSATEVALAALPKVAAEMGVDDEVVEQITTEYNEHLSVIAVPAHKIETSVTTQRHKQYTDLRVAMLGHKRAELIRLRDEGQIDDIVLREVQELLDVDELRMTGRDPVE